MFLIPFKPDSLPKGKCKPVVNTGKTFPSLSTGFHSCLIVYDLKNFKLKSVSPFLHPRYPISLISTKKKRTFVSIGSCLYILDFSVPTTRITSFTYPISYLVTKKNFIFCLSRQEKMAILINPWTLKNFARIFFPKDTTAVELSNKESIENFLYVSTAKGIVEVWNLNNFSHVFSIYLPPFQFVKLLKLNFNSKIIAIKTNQEKILVLNLKEKVLPFFLENKEVKDFQEIFFFAFWKKTIFFSNNRSLFFWNTRSKQIFKTNFLIHAGEIFIGGFIGLKPHFLTIGKKDDTLALHRFVKQGGYFKLVKFQCGNFYPTYKIKSFRNVKGLLLFPDSRSLFQVTNNFGQENEKSRRKEWLVPKIFFNRLNEKLIIKQIIIKRNFMDSDQLTAIFCFYHSKNPWVWKINKKIISQLFLKLDLVQEIKGVISCMTVSPKTNYILVCFTSGFFFYAELETGHLLKKIHNSCFSEIENFFCKISGCDFDERGDFIITGCFHGILKLWDTTLSPKKKLDLEKPILQLHWNIKADLIIVSCTDNTIRFIYPEDFSISKIFKGHLGIINDFLLFGNSKFLITASMDRTIKLWKISNKTCKDTAVCGFPPISLALDKNESILFSSHRNTIGIGLWKFSEYFFPNYQLRFPTLNGKDCQKKEETTSIISTYNKKTFNQIKMGGGVFFNEKKQHSGFCGEKIKKNEIFTKDQALIPKNLILKEKNRQKLDFFQNFLMYNFITFSEINRNIDFPVELSKSFSEKKQKKFFSKKDISVIIMYFTEELIENIMKKHQMEENTKILFIIQNLNLLVLSKTEILTLLERFLTETTRIEIFFRCFFKKCNFF